MDITRENFYELYPIIQEKIKTCKFISFDEEMTGINGTDPLQKYYKDDLPSKRYQKMCPIATKYSIIQFGLCLFHDNPDGNGFIASPYNFYLFPDYGTDIVVSASSIDFLRKNKMDFGTWIGKGLPFVDAKGEEWLRKKYFVPETTAAAVVDQKKQITLTRNSDLEFMEANFKLFQQFLEDPNSEIFEFQDCNSYLRRYIYQQIETLYANDVIIKKSDSSNRLCAYKISKESKLQHDMQQKMQREKDFHVAMGFRQLYNDIVSSKKPLVGHHNFFDLLFMSRWLDCPLPETFDQFRNQLSARFPVIFDTKFIESSGLIPSPSLDSYLNQCYQKYLGTPGVQISIHSDCSSFKPDSENYHNAGYDAYCTGYIFAKQIYRDDCSFQLINDSNQSLYDVTQNKLFCMFSLFNINLNPTENSALSKFPDGTILRVTNFPKAVTTQSFLHVEYSETNGNPYEANLEIVWIDDYSLFIIFPSCSHDDPRVSNYKKLAPAEWNFETLEEYSLSKEKMEEQSLDESVQNNESTVTSDSFLSRTISAILSPFRWAANADQKETENESRGTKRKRTE